MQVDYHINAKFAEIVDDTDHLGQIGLVDYVLGRHESTPHEPQSDRVEAPGLEIEQMGSVGQIILRLVRNPWK